MTDDTGRARPRHRLARATAVAVVATATEAAVVAARRGSLWALDTPVRCRDGHLFTTFWLPGASVKAIRLGWWRFQWCPVGRHWALVTPVRASQLSEDDRALAAGHHDLRLL